MPYPDELDNLPTTHQTGDGIVADTDNKEAAAINALEAKLGLGRGTPPGGGYVMTSLTVGGSSWQPPASGGGGVAIENQGGAVLGTATTLNYTGPGVVASYSAGVGTISISGAGAGSQTPWTVNVLDKGLACDGLTDDSTNLQNFLNANGTVPVTLVFPPGKTSVLNTVTLPAGSDITILGYASTVLHRANADGHMFVGNGPSTGGWPASLRIFGLKLDGNFANQTANYNRTLISTYVQYGAVFRDVHFTHWSRHALNIIDSTQIVILDHCTADFGNEWGNTKAGLGPGNDTCALVFNTVANRYAVVVAFSHFEHGAPLLAGAQPGAINIAGDISGSYPIQIMIANSDFINMGFRSVVGGVATTAQTGVIYMYRVADGSTVHDNTFRNPYFTCVAVTSSSDVTVHDNKLFANNNLSDPGGGYGMSVQGHDHQTTPTATRHRIIFHHNILRWDGTGTAPATQAFYADSISGEEPTEIIWDTNEVDGFATGFQLLWLAGAIKIKGNTLKNLSGNGVLVTNTLTGHLQISHNDFISTGLAAISMPAPATSTPDQSFANLDLDVLFNFLQDTTSGMTLMGDRVSLIGTTWRGTPTAAPLATIGSAANPASLAMVDLNKSTIATPITVHATSYLPANNQGPW